MDAATILKVGHALLGIWVIAILVGRWMTLGQAARSTDLAAVHTLLRLSDRFEFQVKLIPPFVLIIGIATAMVQNRPFLGPFQDAGFDWLFVSIVLVLSVIPIVPLSSCLGAGGSPRRSPRPTRRARSHRLLARPFAIRSCSPPTCTNSPS